MSDYSSERYDPQLRHCGQLRLYFDGYHLRLLGGSQTYSYQAVSGKPVGNHFDYSQERQGLSNEGPIPEGTYWVRPDELDDNSHYCWFDTKSCRSWGRFRLTIHPFTTTETHGRGGFFIHGGRDRGSIGCIDLTSQIDQFAADLIKEVGSNSSCQIHLRVEYALIGDFPLPWTVSRTA